MVVATIPQIPNDKGEKFWILITCKNKINKVNESPADSKCIVLPHWNLSPYGFQNKATVKD